MDSGVVFSLPFLSSELRGVRGPLWRGKEGSSRRVPRERMGVGGGVGTGGHGEEGMKGRQEPFQIPVGTQSSPVADFSKMLLEIHFFIVLFCRQLGKILSPQHKGVPLSYFIFK